MCVAIIYMSGGGHTIYIVRKPVCIVTIQYCTNYLELCSGMLQNLDSGLDWTMDWTVDWALKML